MTRSRNHRSAKAAGTRFETSIATWLAEHYDERVERRARNGSKDRGDISGVFLSPALGGRVVIECKDYGGQLKAGTWLAEAETERGNDDAVAGVVVAKRRGTTDPADQFVLCTVRDLFALLTGQRPEEGI